MSFYYKVKLIKEERKKFYSLKFYSLKEDNFYEVKVCLVLNATLLKNYYKKINIFKVMKKKEIPLYQLEIFDEVTKKKIKNILYNNFKYKKFHFYKNFRLSRFYLFKCDGFCFFLFKGYELLTKNWTNKKQDSPDDFIKKYLLLEAFNDKDYQLKNRTYSVVKNSRRLRSLKGAFRRILLTIREKKQKSNIVSNNRAIVEQLKYYVIQGTVEELENIKTAVLTNKKERSVMPIVVKKENSLDPFISNINKVPEPEVFTLRNCL